MQEKSAASDGDQQMQPGDAGFCDPPWPTMLGGIPVDEEYNRPLAKTCLQNGRTFPITCLSPGQPGQTGKGYVSCFRPRPRD